MEEPRRRVPGWASALLVVVLIVVSLAALARIMGASWQRTVWGALGCLAFSLVGEFFAWLLTGGPLRLEKRPVQDTDRPE